MDLRASLSETYSRAGVRCGGRWWASRMEMPASRGEEIISFNAIFLFYFFAAKDRSIQRNSNGKSVGSWIKPAKKGYHRYQVIKSGGGVRARANSTAYRYSEKQEEKREKDCDLQSQTG